MILGNIANSFVVLNSILYAWVIVCSSLSYHYDRNNDSNILLSPSVLQNGFCISNKESLWWSSHALCFYLDTFFCIVMYRCKLDGAKNKLPLSITEPVCTNISAHFGHGIGHFLLGYVFASRETYDSIRIENMLWLPLFWYGFIQAIHTNSHWKKNILVSVLISLFHVCIPLKFGFMYVQTILLVLASTNDLFLKNEEKDIFYDLKAIIIHVPIGIIGWLEAYLCDSILIYIGGHIWYDCTIPATIILYYIIAKTIYIERQRCWRFF